MGMGGAEMKSRFLRAHSLILIAAVLLLIMAFPSMLYARSVPVVEHAPKSIVYRTRLVADQFNSRQHGQNQQGAQSRLLDQDIRVRAATVLMGDPVIRKSAESERVPLTVLVITAPVILEA